MKIDLILNHPEIVTIFIYMILIIKIKIFYCQKNDDFGIDTLEGEDLIDVTDYHNLSLIATTSKKIYTGIPPNLKITTTANLINASSIITFNDKYLLAACLKDSLLTKINLNNGESTSLLNYDTFSTELNLDIPITSCSLSIIENTIFIGYAKIDYFTKETNKTNIVMRFNITNKESNDGPDIDDTVDKKFFIFPKSIIKTESTKQISCEPLRITKNITYYRLVCVFEDLYPYESKWAYQTFATSINENFDGFEITMYEIMVYKVNDVSGFKLIKLDDTKLKVSMRTIDYDINLALNKSNILVISKSKGNTYNSILDLFDYSHGYITNLANTQNIYTFKIYKKSSDYLNLTDSNGNNLIKIKLYYNNNNIMLAYQFQSKIKYFYILNIQNIENLLSYSKEIQTQISEENEQETTIKQYTDKLKETTILNQPNMATTILNIKTTIPKISTTAPKIMTTIPKIETTIYKTITTIPKIETTLPKIMTTIPKIMTTIHKTITTIPKIETTLPKIMTTIPKIETTIYKTITTIPKIETTIHKIITTIPKTTILKIITTIPKTTILKAVTTIPKTMITIPKIETTIPKIETTILKTMTTISNIETTILKTITTIPKTNITIPKIETTEPNKLSTIPKISTTEPIISITKSTINAIQTTLITTKSSIIRNGPIIISTIPYKILTESTIVISSEKDIAISKITSLGKTIMTTLISSINQTSEIAKESIITETTNSYIHKEIIYPEEYFKNPNDCLVIYNNSCYSHCPEGTCLAEDEKGALINCIPIGPNVKVFNDICFTGLEEIAKDLKEMAQNDEVITTESGITIRGYSTNSGNKDDISVEAKYSIIYLGECESLIKKYYNLSDKTELFILGIDSPSKNKNVSTSVYNYGVYLENGTQLDHITPCKETKISISSFIKNTEQVKLENASYFSDLGYDIYDENSTFYTDNCAPAAIDGNDVTLSDRKKHYYPNDISLCNDSCSYSSVNFTTKRFNCECSLSSDNTQSTNSEENEEEEESYLDYFLSLINYKIATCYELFFDFKSYYYNAGFYIAVGNLVFCIGCMFAFIKWGMLALNRIIYQNIPTKEKLKDILRDKEEKKREWMKYKIGNNNNPPKMRKSHKRKTKNKLEIINSKGKSKDNEENSLTRKNSVISNRVKIRNKASENNKQLIDENKLRSDSNNTVTSLSYIKSTSQKKITRKMLNKKSTKAFNIDDDKPNLKFIKKNKFDNTNIYIKKKNKKKMTMKDIYSLINFINDEEVDNKELNNIPYTQALRIDNRNWFRMFLSVIAHEIEIINIFYYRNPYNHMTIIFSIYTFELCLDLTLNTLLYTDDVVSEKYNNNGSLEFFTSLSLSFMSNVFASIIAFIVCKLADYADVMELMISNVAKERQYIANIIRFKKYLAIKLTGFYIIQMIINLAMCYYLMIFCTVYHKTQGSIMLNYLLGIAQSIGISLGLALITSLIRYLSIKYRWRNIYYTSKYFFDKF